MIRDRITVEHPEYSWIEISLTPNATRRKLYFRSGTSDESVIDMIFRQRQYELSRLKRSPELKAFLDAQKKTRRFPLVVDAGANIGASSIMFSSMVPEAKVVAIEPDSENFRLLAINVLGLPIEVMRSALASVRGHARVFDPGEGHWGYRTEYLGTVQMSEAVPCVTIDDIYQRHLGRCFPFIVKIDIEGGEADLFSANTNWVEHTPLVIIELHDRLLTRSACSKSFLQCVSKLDRDFVSIGENIYSIANHL
jgi:FkbM family methyltransferase